MRKFIETLENKDIILLYAVNRGIKCRIFDFIMPLITYLGSAGFEIVLPIAVIIYKKGSIHILGFELLISLAASHIIVAAIKRVVNRARPWIALENVNSFGIPLYYNSFPSGHTTASFSTAVILLLNFPAFSVTFLSLALLVGISRMYLGVHYPSDVLIGSIIGITFAIITHSIMF